MEIVTIPLKGRLAHKDDMGHQETINANEVQVMSAGTGVLHSEFNPSKIEAANTLQIWIFPDKKGHKPRYDQKSFNPADRKNRLQTLVSPEKKSDALRINQDAYFSRIDLDNGNSISYDIHSSNNGVYIFLLKGQIKTGEDIMNKRDALGVWNTDRIEMNAADNSSILFIEVPMN
jgi:redox-sensitive bicupin YhaK (pirin superfamily)